MKSYFIFKLTIITKDSRGKKATIARKNRNVYELSPPQKLNPQTEFPIDDLRNERNGALRGLQRHRYTSGLLISVYFLGKKLHENIVPSYSSFHSKQSNNLGFFSHQVRSNFLHITKGKNVYSLSNVDRSNIGFYLKCSILFIHSIKLPFIIIKRLTEEP